MVLSPRRGAPQPTPTFDQKAAFPMTNRLQRFREHKDEYFANGENSPIEPTDLDSFTGLDYFPASPELVFTVPLEPLPEGMPEVLDLDTSDGLLAHFRRAGTVSLSIEGEAVQLTVLKDLDRGRFFLPFIDATSGQETYDGGRYLDPQMNRDELLVVDFNYAYNPYCAYGEGWSCPIPPEENHLDVAIRAGEKAYRTGKLVAPIQD
jgi:uncharacterized protein (DUF1684 family)